MTSENKVLATIKVGIGYMGAFFGPVLGLLSASGIIKGLLAIFVFNHLIGVDSSLYALLNAAGDAMFYFFPIILGFSVASKMEMNSYLGAIIGASLAYPALQNMENMHFLGVNISNISYGNTVIPIMLIIVLVAPFERKLMKIMPESIRSFTVPMIVLIVAVPLGFSFVGPAANYLANLFSKGITNLYMINPVISCIVLGSVFPFIIMSGLHFGLITIFMIDLIAGNPNGLMPIILSTSIVQSAVVGMIWLRSSNKQVKSIALPAAISGIFGITEPGLYGLTLPNPKYLGITCIGCGVTGLLIGLNQVMSYIVAGVGVFGLAGMVGPEGFSNAINFIIAVVSGMLVAGGLTFLVFKDEIKLAEDILD